MGRAETNEHALDMPNLLEAKNCAEYARSSNPEELSYWGALKRKGKYCMHPRHAAHEPFGPNEKRKYFYYDSGMSMKTAGICPLKTKLVLEVCEDCFNDHGKPMKQTLESYTANGRTGY